MSRSVSNLSHQDQSPLVQWIERTLRSRGTRIKFKLQGNNLHILCEGNPCPNQTLLLTRALLALHQTDLNRLIPSAQPPLYQVLLYGRQIDRDRPDWGVPIHLNQIDRHLEQLRLSTQHPATVNTLSTSSMARSSQGAAQRAALVRTNQSAARQGDPEALSRYLSETLSQLGVAVKVLVKASPYPMSPSHPHLITPDVGGAAQRLWITCEARYSPDPLLVGEPIAQKVRDLELDGFRDAVILMQVQGEQTPDWLLQVDLTPIQEMLREWARWGDVGAIARLVTHALPMVMQLSTASLHDATLHLFFAASSTVPDRAQVMAAVMPVLEAIAPQGIHAAALYGQIPGQEAPDWVEWVTLPATHHPALAESPLSLASQLDWGAIAFLLNRLLNPNLDRYLATGGVRLQILPKQDLLHVMIDAATCPEQNQTGVTVAQFFRQLQLPTVAGVRVYGRRAGQKHPAWSYGADFVPRQRLVPEATPQFAVSDAYVGELIAQPGDRILRADLTSADVQHAWGSFWQSAIQQCRRLLIGSRLFTPIVHPTTLPLLPAAEAPSHGAAVALIWGAVGLLLAVQMDWALHRALQVTSASKPEQPIAMSPPIAAPPTAPLESAPSGDSPAFNPDDFTTSNPANSSAEPAPSAPEATLPYTQHPPETLALTASVLASDASFSTFNSRQLDEKLKLYQRQLEASGAADVLVVGSSRALRGIDPAALQTALTDLGYTDVQVFNFGINGATAQVVDLIVRRLLTPEQLPRLIIWADGARAFNSGTVDATYNGIAASQGYGDLAAGKLTLPSATEAFAPKTETPSELLLTDGMASLTNSYQTIDRWLSQQMGRFSTVYADRDRLKNAVQQWLTVFFPDQPLPQSVLTAVLNQVTGEYADASTTSLSQLMLLQGQETPDLQGFLPLSMRFNPATYYQKYAKVPGEYDSDYEDFQVAGAQEAALRSLLDYTRSRQIPVVFVNLPLTQEYLDPIRLRHEQEFEEYMLTLAVSQSGLIYRDLSEAWGTSHDYFSDPSHLNRYGAYQVSNRLAQDSLIPWQKSAHRKD